MKNVLLFAGYLIRKPAVLCAMILLFLASFFIPGYKRLAEDRPCAVYFGDDSEAAAHVAEQLSGYNFVFCDSEEEVKAQVARLDADCGMVFSDTFGATLSETGPDAAVVLYRSEHTAKENFYKFIAASAVLCEYMPYASVNLAEKYGIGADYGYYGKCLDRVKDYAQPLEFELENVEGAGAVPVRICDLQTGVTAIVSFLVLAFLVFGFIRRNMNAARQRMNAGARFLHIVLPQSLIAAVYLFLAGQAGQALGSAVFKTDRTVGWIADALYLLVTALILAAVCMLRLDGNLLFGIASLEACISIFLCPLFLDIGLLLPGAGILRVVSVPYLLYCFQGLL